MGHLSAHGFLRPRPRRSGDGAARNASPMRLRQSKRQAALARRRCRLMLTPHSVSTTSDCRTWASAADQFEEALRLASISAAPLLRVQFLPDLIEANVRAARSARAAELMAEFEVIAEQMQRPSAVLLAARCRGLHGRTGRGGPFPEALAHSDATVPRFERARTALYYGDVLRRAKRRSEARVQFQYAYEEFERLGAAPWAERAGKWLGASAANEAIRARQQLTPQELQVALAVSKGMTQLRSGRGAVSQCEDGRIPPSARLRKGRRPVTDRTGTADDVDHCPASPAPRPSSGRLG